MDHLGRGGVDFIYRIEFQPVTAEVDARDSSRTARYSQDRQRIYVAKGNRFAKHRISASRANFGGELVLEDMQLPAGLNIDCGCDAG